MKLVIKNGRVMDPASGRDEVKKLLALENIQNGQRKPRN